MSTHLLRRLFGPLLLLALLVLGIRPAQATHLLGGEMSYRYLDANGTTAAPFRYEVTVIIYSNGLYPSTPGITGPPATAPITIYNRTTGLSLGNYSPSRQGVLGQPVAPHVPAGCAVVGPSQPFYLCRYVQVVNLPFAADGYYAVFTPTPGPTASLQ